MTIRNTAITKLQQLPEPLLQEVSDFIDFVIRKHQVKIIDEQSNESHSEAWSKWFETVNYLEVTSPASTTDYQQFLLNKYRQQGLDL